MGTIIMTSAYRSVLLYGLLIALVLCVVVSGKKLPKERGEEEPESGRKSRGIWFGGDHRTGHDHGHGHGWLKMHNDRHHGHSTKLSEAYVKFHGLGEKGNKGGGGIFGKIGNVLSQLGIGNRGDPDEDNNESGWGSNSNSNNNNNNNNNNNGGGGGGGGGWGSGGGGGGQGQEFLTVTVQKPSIPMTVSGGGGGGGGGGWGAPPPMMQMQSGWSMPQMQAVVAQPTGWASANNQQNSGNDGGNKGGNSGGGGGGKQTGWATGDFSSYKPPKGNKNQGHFQFNLPTGKPAYIQKLKPIIDLPKIHLHGLGWR